MEYRSGTGSITHLILTRFALPINRELHNEVTSLTTQWNEVFEPEFERALDARLEEAADNARGCSWFRNVRPRIEPAPVKAVELLYDAGVSIPQQSISVAELNNLEVFSDIIKTAYESIGDDVMIVTLLFNCKGAPSQIDFAVASGLVIDSGRYGMIATTEFGEDDNYTSTYDAHSNKSRRALCRAIRNTVHTELYRQSSTFGIPIHTPICLWISRIKSLPVL